MVNLSNIAVIVGDRAQKQRVIVRNVYGSNNLIDKVGSCLINGHHHEPECSFSQNTMMVFPRSKKDDVNSHECSHGPNDPSRTTL